MKTQAAWLKLVIAEISFLVFPTIFLFLIKLAILRSEIEILLALISTNLLVPKREIERAVPSQEFSLVGWFSAYKIKVNSNS